MQATNALIIAPQWIGDAVMTEPLLRRLHARGERLTVGALPWVAPVYRAMPQVAEVIEFPFAHGGLQLKARRALARQLEGRFDVAYVLPNSLKSALLPWLARVPMRVGYLGEARLGLLTQRLKNPPKQQRPPMVAFYSALSGESDVAADRPRLQIEAARCDAVLDRLGLSRGAYYVFVPGAEYGPAKRWPAARFAELAQRLELPVLLLGSGKEAALGDEIIQRAHTGQRQNSRNLAGRTDLLDAFCLIAAAKAMVSNDTGLMHVAAALDVPQVALFGSSSPLHTPPLSDQAQVIWLKNDPGYQPPLDCAPCFQRECPLGHLRCLNDITAGRVLQVL
ncbi:MAG: lipopolysaccharide heptosyltransferase II [Rhodoferax sp.]|uniref:lipopolysaccharide heptosyltransferase II n=1 Tax=Rhodoferax sp. TaxID=50421 RepID=UPI00272F4CE9|nr:lipopolysaccharide heptosyltransferase II [Rhodoferax sp.]MDP1527847.1 lipopolysaccharide heptosyltransferase II [Rhodoferax sp.]MDP1938596.1 lipopolysaccharide heptosyltransferase II [Hylemonella sp.]